MASPIRGKLTLQAVADAASAWCRKGIMPDGSPVSVRHALAWYRQAYGLSEYRCRQLRKLLATG